MSSERPSSQPAQALARVLREARGRTGLSAAEFAARAGIEPSDYQALERGERAPELETIVRIADALGLRASDLLDRAGL
ncbi:MAG TPA: helix-turn-helix transcriptional regulator [Solirubrobacteraceae bacterium]|jgi:transcriptional regulator with XRE-family HTH domain|nr:helix-turn-helix transcriptional regulator [Solirubrobacteraceae bacterium]